MRTIVIFLIFAFASQATLGQTTNGISVQGIARDADKAALVDEPLKFTFEIQDSGGGTSYYKEDVDIKTDPYGVFSHIIGTGNVLAGSGDFIAIPFGQTHMKLVISVNYNGNDIVISNAPFQYTPYAKSAENGVPTGTIVAYTGEEADIPQGWILCDGRTLSTIEGSINLSNLIGPNVPDLRGMFLRGTGTSSVNGQNGPALLATQDDGLESHLHAKGTIATSNAGSHSHTVLIGKESDDADGDGGPVHYGPGANEGSDTKTSSTEPAHSHTVTGSTALTGINETRPVSFGINYIIKL